MKAQALLDVLALVTAVDPDAEIEIRTYRDDGAACLTVRLSNGAVIPDETRTRLAAAGWGEHGDGEAWSYWC